MGLYFLFAVDSIQCTLDMMPNTSVILFFVYSFYFSFGYSWCMNLMQIEIITLFLSPSQNNIFYLTRHLKIHGVWMWSKHKLSHCFWFCLCLTNMILLVSLIFYVFLGRKSNHLLWNHLLALFTNWIVNTPLIWYNW